MNYSIVWFKRDLRAFDHEALHSALSKGPILCLYILEPSYWMGLDVSKRQLDFLKESLRDLAKSLKSFDLKLCLRTGEAQEVFSMFYNQLKFDAVYSHEETGNQLTFRRDQMMSDWFKAKGIFWLEFRQHGVVRGLQKRVHWVKQWEHLMQVPQYGIEPQTVDKFSQKTINELFPSEHWPNSDEWIINQEPCDKRQIGGRSVALEVMTSFLEERSNYYSGGISSPLKATSACSRISPYLALGCLSLREVAQATKFEISKNTTGSYQKKGLHNFLSRLHWHCHFIQKLESEPEIEFQNMHHGYDGLREYDWNEEHFQRLINAKTGWPLVDACVVMLQETGWLNFRMRAMLVSVAAYPLWLHWKKVGDWLASQLVDYEPGIHWSQMQMQSGTTGINTVRVYNPIKQAIDHDPEGKFVRTWLPVLKKVPDAWLFEPWKMTQEIQTRCGVMVGEDWPIPVVDLTLSTSQAKKRVHEFRVNPGMKKINAVILERHGSNSNNWSTKMNGARSSKAKGKEFQITQQELDF
jgi:deoxyribodipyrimidine photo-lyase